MPAPVTDPGHIPGPTFIPNCIAIRLQWQLANGKLANNILHGAYTGIPGQVTQGHVDSLFGTLKTDFTATVAPYMHTETALLGIGVRDMAQVPGSSPPVGYGEFQSAGTAINGTESTLNPMPCNVAFVITLKTGLSRQANRGRVYLPGWSTFADDGVSRIKVAAADAAKNFIVDVDTALEAAFTPPLVFCIAHPARQEYVSERTGHTVPARNAGTVTVESVTYRDTVWDTQRLRVRL